MNRRFDLDLDARASLWPRASRSRSRCSAFARRGLDRRHGRPRPGARAAWPHRDAAVIDEARRTASTRSGSRCWSRTRPRSALYDALGFTMWRELEVWSLGTPLPPRRAEIDAADARAWIAAHRPAREPWQRADASLDRFHSAEQPLPGSK